MKIKNKLYLSIILMIISLLVIPFVFINISKPHEFMGIMMLLFFVINPVVEFILSLIVGKDIRVLWWIPITFCIIFLISYWIILNEVILDLLVYAIGYLIIGLIFMFISLFISNERK